jgi:epoxyqueuosine reductase
LADLFALDDDAFRARFRHTPLWRSKRRGVLRNAAIVLGNQGGPRGLAPLILGLNDDEPLVRGASAWALGRLGEEQAGNALQQRLAAEQDATVRDEIKRALDAPTE